MKAMTTLQVQHDVPSFTAFEDHLYSVSDTTIRRASFLDVHTDVVLVLRTAGENYFDIKELVRPRLPMVLDIPQRSTAREQ